MEIYLEELGVEIELKHDREVYFAKHIGGNDPEETIYEKWKYMPDSDQKELQVIFDTIREQAEKVEGLMRRNENCTPTDENGDWLHDSDE